MDERSALLVAVFPLIALGLLNGLYTDVLYRQSLVLYWVADVGQYAIVPAAAFVFLTQIAGVRAGDIGFRRLQWSIEDLGLVVFVFGAFWLAYEPVRLVAWGYWWRYAPNVFAQASAIPESGMARSLVIGYYAATAALVEEIVFRGALWRYFSLAAPRRMLVPLYVGVTAVLFAAIHSEQGPHGVIAAFTLGVVAAGLYSKVQTLWPFIIAHFAMDVLGFSGLGLK